MKPSNPLFTRSLKRFLGCGMATALATPATFAADRTWASSPASATWSVAGNWGGTAPVANDTILFGTSSILALNNDLAANTYLRAITYNPGANAFTFSGNALNLNGDIINGSSNAQVIGFPVGLRATTNNVTGGAGVSITGTTTSGILGGVVGANRTIINNLTAGSLTLGNVDLSINPDSSVRILTLEGAGNTIISGVIANGSSAVAAKNRLTYSGTGTLLLNGTIGSTYTGSTTINSGTLNLDFSNMSVPTNLLGLSNLTLGANLIMKAKGGAVNSQAFNGLTAIANRASGFVVNQNGATAFDITLDGITRNDHATMDFVLPTAGTVTTSSAGSANGIATNSSGTAYQTVGGTTWLGKTATAPYTLTAFPNASYVSTYTATDNVDVGSSDFVTGVTVSSLRFSGAPEKSLFLDGINTITTGGILVTPAAANSLISGGTLRGNPNGGNRELLVIDNGSLEIVSTIANNGSGSSLTVAGSGITKLSGNNTFTGDVSINQGTTQLGTSQSGTTSSALGAGGGGAPGVTIAPGAILDLNGYDQTLGTIGSSAGTILNGSGLPSILTVKNNSIQNGVIVSGGDMDLVCDVGAMNIYQINDSLRTFSGRLVQRSGIIRSNTYQTDFGSSRIVFDVSSAGAIGSNETLGVNNSFTLVSGTGSFPNAIAVTSAGFINHSGGRTLSGPITGGGVLNLVAGSATLTGDNSQFLGTYNLWRSGASIFINSPSAASATSKYTFSAEGTPSGTSAYVANIPGGGIVEMGELSTSGATGNSQLRNNVNNSTATFRVGGLDTNSSFGGTIADGTGTAQVTALTKVGIGTLNLTGNSTYSGATNVESGTLSIESPRSLSTASAVTVLSGGTIAGTGTFSGPVTVSGTIAPGTGVGTLTTGPTTLSGTLAIEVSGSSADKLISTGNLNITGATLSVTESSAGTLPSYVIAEGTSLTGTFGASQLPAGYSITYTATQVTLNRGVSDAYASWVSGYPLLVTPADKLPATDFDHDGFSNLMEFTLSGDPGASSQSIRPIQTLDATRLLFSFKRNDASESPATIQSVEVTNDLSNWTNGIIPPIVIGGISSSGTGYSVTILENVDGPDDVTVAIDRGQNVRLFARLKVAK